VREMCANAEPWNAADALLYKSFASPRPPAIEVGPQHRRFCICVDKRVELLCRPFKQRSCDQRPLICWVPRRRWRGAP